MSGRTIIYILVGLALCLGMGAWISMADNSKPVTEPKKSAPVLTVSVARAEHKSLEDLIQVVGVMVPREDVLVIPEATGLRIQDIYAEVGDTVKKGQRLALLDSESLKIQLDGLRTELELTRADYQRLATLQPSGAVSAQSVTQRRAAYEVARSRWEDAQLSINRTSIVAPTDGLVYERRAAIGSLTNGDEPLFRIARNGEIEAEAAVPESVLQRVRPAMSVRLDIAGNPSPVIGTVRLVMPRVDHDSRSAGVRINFKRDGFVAVGTFCQAGITVGTMDGWVLPGTAVQQDTKGTFVWAVNEHGNVVRESITIASRTPESVVIAEALEGRMIVVRSGSFLRDGDLVAVAQGS
jgi:HlyD family secretion protein